MNSEIIVHPKLQHLGLATSNMDVTLDWYRTVLGMVVHYRAAFPAGAPFSAMALVSNDEVHHRIAFFEMCDRAGSNQSQGSRIQHIAFEYATLDELLGSYERLNKINIIPKMALDEGTQTSFYYEDPDKNSVELNVNNYGNDWAATEHMQLTHTTG